MPIRKHWKRYAVLAALLIFLASLGVLMASSRTRLSINDDEIPTGAAIIGDLDLRIHTVGELRASHSATLIAPPIGGGALQITHLLMTGSPVKKDEIVLEFDPSEQEYKLEQSRSELLQAEQEITKARSDAAVQAAEDKVALLKARFDVRRAELEVTKNELVSSIDARKNDLSLDQAKRALAQLQQDVSSHTASGQATIDLALEKRHKAELGMAEAQRNIERMKVRSPIDGVLAIEKNLDSTGGMFWGGMSLPDYREGDEAHPGASIARVIDLSDMELVVKIKERERGNIKVGEDAEIRFDALPADKFRGTVKNIAGMSMKNFWDDDTGGSFEATIRLPKPDPRLRVGLTAEAIVFGETKKKVLSIPRQAVFSREGKHVVYVKNGRTFEAREITIVAGTESRAAVEGIHAGDQVALLDPTVSRKQSEHSASEPKVQGAR